MAERTQTTVREFLDFIEGEADSNKRYELINGEIIEMAPVGGVHGNLSVWLGGLIEIHVRQHNLGKTTSETGYRDPDDDTNLIAPDIGFIRRERAPVPFPEGIVNALPNFAIEIVSPGDLNNKTERITKKVTLYRKLRVPLVWYVYPRDKQVVVYRPDVEPQTMKMGDTLDASDVLDGFTISVTKIFS